MQTGLGPLLVLFAAGVFAAAPARAVSIGFDCLTQNDPDDCAIGESQFSVQLTDLGGGSVRFHFSNAGPLTSVLSEIYFDDGALLALAAVIDGPGVDFEPDANPPNLPGGQNAVPPFQVTQGFLAEAVPSPAKNGVGPSEWVKIDFTLQNGMTFADVVEDLTTGDLRIGIHVIAFDSGGSESFVNTPIPEPGTVLLVGSGLVALRSMRRRPARPTGRLPGSPRRA